MVGIVVSRELAFRQYVLGSIPDATYVGWIWCFSTVFRKVFFRGHSSFPVSPRTNISFDYTWLSVICWLYDMSSVNHSRAVWPLKRKLLEPYKRYWSDFLTLWPSLTRDKFCVLCAFYSMCWILWLDMAAERNALMERTYPRLKAFAQQKGYEFQVNTNTNEISISNEWVHFLSI